MSSSTSPSCCVRFGDRDSVKVCYFWQPPKKNTGKPAGIYLFGSIRPPTAKSPNDRKSAALSRCLMAIAAPHFSPAPTSTFAKDPLAPRRSSLRSFAGQFHHTRRCRLIGEQVSFELGVFTWRDCPRHGRGRKRTQQLGLRAWRFRRISDNS
jgi:hypothetical protein